jgi:protein-tyrosine phosphatase
MKKILFVCLGNICRSPMAEAILKHKVISRSDHHEFHIESAGTGDWHIGHSPDERTLKTLLDQGCVFEGKQAQQVRMHHFDFFDLILAMDRKNYLDLKNLSSMHQSKVHLFLDYVGNDLKEVPDPYYQELRAFQSVYRLLDEAIEKLLGTL